MVQADGIPEETDGSVTTRLESFELRRVINAHSFDNAGCIPDFILARCVSQIVVAICAASVANDKWHGRTRPAAPVTAPESLRSLETNCIQEDFAGHTPGPWGVADADDLVAGEVWITARHPTFGAISLAAVRDGCEEAAEMGNRDANARLISAAPDLLKQRDESLSRISALEAEVERLRSALVDEREACAKLADDEHEFWLARLAKAFTPSGELIMDSAQAAAKNIAIDIRARAALSPSPDGEVK